MEEVRDGEVNASKYQDDDTSSSDSQKSPFSPSSAQKGSENKVPSGLDGVEKQIYSII